MNGETIKFCFKGERDYVHGTDIFNKVIELIIATSNSRKIQNIDMSIRKISNHNLIIKDNIEGNKSFENLSEVVTFSANYGEKKSRIALMESNEEITCRYPYDEESIIAAASFTSEKKEIKLVNFKNYTIIEKIVALNKGLLTRLYPSVRGKWYFTRLKIKEFSLLEQNPNDIKLLFRKSLQLKFVETEVYLDNIFAGNIYFSLV